MSLNAIRRRNVTRDAVTLKDITQWTPAYEDAVRTRLGEIADLTEAGWGTTGMYSMPAINLAVTGVATSGRPACMSRVVHAWLVGVQEWIPDDVSGSRGWRDLLPSAPGGGNSGAAEEGRCDLVREWMWDALERAQSTASDQGFGAEWQLMLTDRTYASAHAASIAAAVVPEAASAAAAAARTSTHSASSGLAHDAAVSAAVSAVQDGIVAAGAGSGTIWAEIDPAALLERLIHVPGAPPIGDETLDSLD